MTRRKKIKQNTFFEYSHPTAQAKEIKYNMRKSTVNTSG